MSGECRSEAGKVGIRDTVLVVAPELVRLAPLTLLVGDNDTGKSRFAVCMEGSYLGQIDPASHSGYLESDDFTDDDLRSICDFVQRYTGLSGRSHGYQWVEIRDDAEKPREDPGISGFPWEDPGIRSFVWARVCLALNAWFRVYRGKSRLWVEHPTNNLHPRQQRQIARLVAQLVADGHPLLIETHSLDFVTEIGMEIAHGKLRPADVSVLCFVRPKAGPTHITEATFDTEGVLHGWPPGLL